VGQQELQKLNMAIKTLSSCLEVVLLDEQRKFLDNNVRARTIDYNTNQKNRTTKIESFKNTLGIILFTWTAEDK